MRLFVALHLESDLAAAVVALQARLRRADGAARVRWVDPHGIHLTLQFLGEVAEERVGTLRQALATAIAGHRAPNLGLGAVGAFPNLHHPRVYWVGLTESGAALEPLRLAVEAATEPLGWAPERRAFQPHLTLGRAKEGPNRAPLPPGAELVAALREAEVAPGARPHRRVALVRSHLSPSGARYEDIAAWDLMAPEVG